MIEFRMSVICRGSSAAHSVAPGVNATNAIGTSPPVHQLTDELLDNEKIACCNRLVLQPHRHLSHQGGPVDSLPTQQVPPGIP